MRAIEVIRERLSAIPFGRWAEPKDAKHRPPHRIGRRESKLTWKPPGAEIVFEGDGDFEYPDFLEREFLSDTDRRVASDGIDVLAWYVSFHVSGDDWGIYVPLSSLVYLEHRCLKSFPGGRFRKWQVGFELLIQHELFHFASDYMCAQWEILMQRPCWVPLKERCIEANRYIELEEKLANAHMVRALERTWPAGVRAAIRSFVQNQPAGYNQAFTCLDDEKFVPDLTELTKIYVGLIGAECDLCMWSDAFDYAALFPLFPVIDSAQVPLHIIHDERLLRIPEIAHSLVTAIADIVETASFRKQLAKLDPEIKRAWKRKIRLLARRVPRYPEFKKLSGKLGGIFSIRLNRGFRAHLRPIEGKSSWEAVGIGSHSDMGHG